MPDSGRHAMLAYRADIDGLRGVAIAAVLAYHGGFAFGGGGYVGVDVFFVVSGYLITALILAESAAGRFTTVGFYERRVRRLLPALLVVMAATGVAASVLFLPEELRRFGGSLFATSVFSSNFFFWLETGYFQTAAELKPLIHTWSLAVEEQFYLLVPLLLLPALRLRSQAVAAWVIGLLLVSLGASEWAVRSAPSAAFYVTPFRVWELALGMLLALPVVPTSPSGWMRTASAWLGLALIVWSALAYSWQTSFPGLHALAPCAGAALVIWSGSGGDTPVKRLLSLRPVVFLGLISYSLYLWHWPVLSFARYWAVRELDSGETAALLAGSVVLAALSWRFIERPFRVRNGVLDRRRLFAAVGAATAAIAGVGLSAVVAAGWPARIDDASLHLASAAGDRNPRSEACSFLDSAAVREGRSCLLGAAGRAVPSFVVWGDSHADALMPMFDELAHRFGVAGLYLGRIGCPPLLGVDRPGTDFNCRSFNEAARHAIVESGARTVILVARWSHYSSEPIYKHEARVRMVISDATTAREWPAAVEGNDAVMARGLRRTLASLAGHDVVLVSGVPEIGYEVPEVLARLRHLGRHVDIRPSVEDYERRQQAVQSVLDAQQRQFAFIQLHPARPLCERGACQVVIDDHPLYVDSHHLSRHGAAFVAGEFEPIFRGLAGAQEQPASTPTSAGLPWLALFRRPALT
jgi:peptidoglycan/LPS O-acetylase OafA/YrhL